MKKILISNYTRDLYGKSARSNRKHDRAKDNYRSGIYGNDDASSDYRRDSSRYSNRQSSQENDEIFRRCMQKSLREQDRILSSALHGNYAQYDVDDGDIIHREPDELDED